MEWNNGTGQPHPANKPAAPVSSVKKAKSKWLSLTTVTVALIICIALLILSIALYVGIAKPSNSQSKYVDSGKMQAVFLNGGQVYFGKISTINSSYMRITDIYYLRVNQQVQPNGSTSGNQDISLVKLGCELHGPQDSMVVNQQQVIFWENLKSDGQVAKAVADYRKQNPNGQQCNTNTQSNSSNTSNSSSTSNTNSTTNSSTSTTKKP
jgi:hypothetical protein